MPPRPQIVSAQFGLGEFTVTRDGQRVINDYAKLRAQEQAEGDPNDTVGDLGVLVNCGRAVTALLVWCLLSSPIVLFSTASMWPLDAYRSLHFLAPLFATCSAALYCVGFALWMRAAAPRAESLSRKLFLNTVPLALELGWCWRLAVACFALGCVAAALTLAMYISVRRAPSACGGVSTRRSLGAEDAALLAQQPR